MSDSEQLRRPSRDWHSSDGENGGTLALYIGGSDQARVLTTAGQNPQKTWKIGRTNQNDVVLRWPQVSARHARLRFDEESAAWQVCDLQSTNGTLLRGKALPPHRWRTIEEGDKAFFGQAEAKIVFSYRVDSTLRQTREPVTTEARSEALSFQEWQAWAAGEATTPAEQQGAIAFFLSWVIQPTTVMGGLYRILILMLLAIAGVALAIWAS